SPNPKTKTPLAAQTGCAYNPRSLDQPTMKRLILLSALLVLALHSAWTADASKFSRTPDIIYGHKYGVALTFDVFQPQNPNGAAVFFMVSGGFVSRHESISDRFFRPLLEHGYTVFAVTHGSQPKFIIPEIQEDIHRAIRFARKEAGRWKVDPDKFGICGISSG